MDLSSATVRGQRQAIGIAIANLIPVVGLVAGTVSLVEVVLVYVLEVVFVSAAVCAKLLVIDPQASGRTAPTLIRIGRPWTPQPVRITYWNVDQALFTWSLQFSFIAGFVGIPLALGLGIAASVGETSPLDTVSSVTVGLAAGGLLLVHASEWWRFVSSGAPAYASHELVKDRIVRRTKVVFTTVFGLYVTFFALIVIFSIAIVPVRLTATGVLVGFLVLKILVEIRHQRSELQWLETYDGDGDIAHDPTELSEDDLLHSDCVAPPAFSPRLLVAFGLVNLVPIVGFFVAGWSLATLAVLYAVELALGTIVLRFLAIPIEDRADAHPIAEWFVVAVGIVLFGAISLVFSGFIFAGTLLTLALAPIHPPDVIRPSLIVGLVVVVGTYVGFFVRASTDGGADDRSPKSVGAALSATSTRCLLPIFLTTLFLVLIEGPAVLVPILAALKTVLEAFRYGWAHRERSTGSDPQTDGRPGAALR
ncbi:DUF6498-containing protein [Halovivax gelatinilyticus]|uniref:DUF6498-containing protein n=1 Tax=Halovivax gelatinilyticus TaxID=2961597 RepID=UPI0020CA98B2|nr:DUF6498-containing protein [Halovivax gelatinilyticus]